MLSKLFKSRVRFDDPDPVARRRAVLDIPDADAGQFQDELAEVAATDPDIAVRRAAVGRITQVDLLKKLLTDRQDNKGWLVTFLGAEVDAFDEAGAIGIHPGKYLHLKKSKLRQSFQHAAASQSRYMQTGDLTKGDFTAEERKDADTE